MTREPDSDKPVDQWTLLPDELRLVAGKPTTNRLGFALMLKFFARRGRFPRGGGEVPNAAIEYVAKQVSVAPIEFAAYERSGRTVERHRAQIRQAFGFRECTLADADKLIDYLVAQVAQEERRPERVGEELLARCKAERIEPPAKTRLDRIVGSALRQAEDILFERVTARLSPEVRARLTLDLMSDGRPLWSRCPGAE